MKLIYIAISIGIIFSTVGAVTAKEVQCLPVAPHVSQPVCLDVPHGPRFTVRK